MKIYTKSGDKGKTSLLGGAKVEKSHMRIEAYGTIDELNSYIGLVCDQEINRQRTTLLRGIQNELFIIGSHLASGSAQDTSKLPQLTPELVHALEQAIDTMDQQLPELRNFLLPGGHQSVSFCHIARCVCRRAERRIVALSVTEEVSPLVITYLNRLSDYLFVLARKMGQELNAEEIPWKGQP
jgi:cob(I)alamin adenosyltransferase